MKLLEKWNEYMGPKDERLEAESNRAVRVGYYILLGGIVLCIYYGLMVEQVSNTTETPLYTSAGLATVPLYTLLTLVLLAGTVLPLCLQLRQGIVSEHSRYAEIDHVPWGYVAILSVVCGVLVGVLSAGMRVIAEAQIVGIDQVAWAGDIAIGIVTFGMAFGLAFVFAGLMFRDAIKNRKRIEQEIEEG